MYRLIPLLFLSFSAFAANLTLNSTIAGTVRRSTDAANVNLFSSNVGTITNANPPSPEFSGSFTQGTVPMTISADFNRFDNSILFQFALVNVADSVVPPIFIFSFSGVSFTPAAILAGFSVNGGTPGYFNLPVVTGPDSFTMTTTGAGFLQNGGSAGFSFYLEETEVPEPATFSLLVLGAVLLTGGRLTRRNMTSVPSKAMREDFPNLRARTGNRQTA
jgi:hypothetical protein